MFGNWFKTSLLMAAIVALFGVVGALLGGAQGMLIALMLGGAMANGPTPSLGWRSWSSHPSRRC